MKKNLFFLFTGILFGISFTFVANIFQKNLEDYFVAQISKPFEEITVVNFPKIPKKSPPEIEAKAVISVRINENKKEREKILFAKNENEILSIASLTKLVTALIVFEDPENYELSREVIISKEAANQENVPEYGNLKKGEKRKIRELLSLMLYFSSNDAAFALSQVIGVENFVDKMNQKVKDLNLENTHFTNPTGLDPENLKWNQGNQDYFNYSTAKDLVQIGKYIFKEFPIIFEFSNQKSKINLLENQKIIGIKTGYTDEAGGCIFLIFSEEDGDYFFNVILGTKSKEERFFQMQKLIDWINS